MKEVVLVYLGSRHLCVFTSLRCWFQLTCLQSWRPFRGEMVGAAGGGGGGGGGGGAAPLPPIPHDLTALPEYIRLKQRDH